MENKFLLCLDGPSLSFNFDDKMRQKSTTKAAKKNSITMMTMIKWEMIKRSGEEEMNSF